MVVDTLGKMFGTIKNPKKKRTAKRKCKRKGK